MPTNSEAIGAISLFKSVLVPSYALSRRRRKRRVRGRPVLYNRAVLPHKTTKLLTFVFSFDLNNKLNDPIVGNIVRSEPRVFNDFIVGVKSSYMKVSSRLVLPVAVIT